MQHLYLVSYDISDPGRLRRVHRVVRDFGEGIQLSVFLCQLTRRDRAVLENRLLDVMNQHDDQVMFVHLGVVTDSAIGSRIQTLGRPLAPGFVRTVVF